jgi:hypothetical protein
MYMHLIVKAQSSCQRFHLWSAKLDAPPPLVQGNDHTTCLPPLLCSPVARQRNRYTNPWGGISLTTWPRMDAS